MGRAAARRGTAPEQPIAVLGPRGSVPDPSSSPPQGRRAGPRCDALGAGGRSAAGRTATRCRPGLGPHTRPGCAARARWASPPRGPVRPPRGHVAAPQGPVVPARPARPPPTAAARAPGASRTHRGRLRSTWWWCRGPRLKTDRALHGPRRREPPGAADRTIRPGTVASQNRFTRRGRGGGRRRREQRGEGSGRREGRRRGERDDEGGDGREEGGKRKRGEGGREGGGRGGGWRRPEHAGQLDGWGVGEQWRPLEWLPRVRDPKGDPEHTGRDLSSSRARRRLASGRG